MILSADSADFSAFLSGDTFDVLRSIPKAALEAKSQHIYDLDSNHLRITDVLCSRSYLHLMCVLQQ